MKVARLVLAPLAGLFFFLFIALDLLLFGVIPLSSNLIPGLAIAGLVIGFLIGVYGLFRSAPAAPAAPAMAAPAAGSADASAGTWGAPAAPAADATTAPAPTAADEQPGDGDDGFPPPPPGT